MYRTSRAREDSGIGANRAKWECTDRKSSRFRGYFANFPNDVTRSRTMASEADDLESIVRRTRLLFIAGVDHTVSELKHAHPSPLSRIERGEVYTYEIQAVTSSRARRADAPGLRDEALRDVAADPLVRVGGLEACDLRLVRALVLPAGADLALERGPVFGFSRRAPEPPLERTPKAIAAWAAASRATGIRNGLQET